MGHKRRGHDYSGLLIWAALLVAAVRYAGAFVASDVGRVDGWLSDVLSAGMVVSGLGMGVLDVVGAAYVLDGWRRALPRTGQRWPVRFRVLTGFLVCLFGSGVVILVPFTVSRVLGASMDDVLVGMWLWVWAVLVNLAPYLVVGGVVFAQSGVVVVDNPLPNPPPKWGGNKAGGAPSRGSATSPAPTSRKRYVCPQCGRRFANQQGLAAHSRFCRAQDAQDAAQGSEG